LSFGSTATGRPVCTVWLCTAIYMHTIVAYWRMYRKMIGPRDEVSDPSLCNFAGDCLRMYVVCLLPS
jgi:hypothetical protein